jgi:hypothetical protein
MSAETKKAGEDWGDIENPPKEKRGLPRWLLFCGGGCIVAALLCAIGLYFAMRFMKEGMDEEQQYPKLEQHIGLDHRLTDYKLAFGAALLGTESYTFLKEKTVAVLFVADTDEERKQYDALLDPAITQGTGQLGRREDIEAGTIPIQGRDLRIIRAIQKQFRMPGQSAKEGASAYLDITPEGSVDKLYLMYMKLESMDRVTDEELALFLAPFRVGPAHVESKLPEQPPTEGDAADDKEGADGDH